mgnify:FL=1
MIYDYYGYYQSPMTQFMDMGFFFGGRGGARNCCRCGALRDVYEQKA